MAWPWPAPTDDGAAGHLVCGTPLPDVALVSTAGPAVNLNHYKGPAVVFIYPWTGAPGVSNPPDWDAIPGAHGSTPEAEGFRDHHAAFAARGLAIFGLSTQETGYQSGLAGRLALPFALLSDSQFAFANALRLPTFETGGTRYLKRLTLLVADGRITRSVYPVHPPDTHAAVTLASLPTP